MSQERFILVAFVNHEEVGKTFRRRRDEWPYHVTLVPWFVANKARLDALLRQTAVRQKSFEATIGSLEHFGDDDSIPVNLIESPGTFRALHTQLLESVKDAGGTDYDERWLHDAYKPHVTRHFDGREGYEVGEAFTVPGFYLVRVDADNMCTIDSYYSFGKTDETTT